MYKEKNKEIKFALVGCGQIAHKHMTALRRLPDVKITGVYDTNPQALQSFADQYQVPAYTDIDRLITEADPDILDILTPSGTHAQNILDFVRYNRHFVVEKPLALRLDQVDSILKECDQRGLKIFVVKQNRFNPPVQALKRAIDEKRFGKMVLGTVRVRWCRRQDYYSQKPWRGTWAFDGGVLTNQASHHIDMLIWMMGEVESVIAKTATRLVDIEAEDTGIVILKFKNGAMGLIEATTATRPQDLEGSISVLGENGSVEISGFFMNELKTWNFSQPHAMDHDIWEQYSKVPPDAAWNHTEFFKDVTDSLITGKRGLIDGLEGRKTIEMLNAIYESSSKGQEVYLNSMSGTCKLGKGHDQ